MELIRKCKDCSDISLPLWHNKGLYRCGNCSGFTGIKEGKWEIVTKCSNSNCQQEGKTQWRKSENGQGHVCNACYVHRRNYNSDRIPKSSKRPLSCSYCSSTKSDEWHNKQTSPLCTACYHRGNGASGEEAKPNEPPCSNCKSKITPHWHETENGSLCHKCYVNKNKLSGSNLTVRKRKADHLNDGDVNELCLPKHHPEMHQIAVIVSYDSDYARSTNVYTKMGLHPEPSLSSTNDFRNDSNDLHQSDVIDLHQTSSIPPELCPSKHLREELSTSDLDLELSDKQLSGIRNLHHPPIKQYIETYLPNEDVSDLRNVHRSSEKSHSIYASTNICIQAPIELSQTSSMPTENDYNNTTGVQNSLLVDQNQIPSTSSKNGFSNDSNDLHQVVAIDLPQISPIRSEDDNVNDTNNSVLGDQRQTSLIPSDIIDFWSPFPSLKPKKLLVDENQIPSTSSTNDFSNDSNYLHQVVPIDLPQISPIRSENDNVIVDDNIDCIDYYNEFGF